MKVACPRVFPILVRFATIAIICPTYRKAEMCYLMLLVRDIDAHVTRDNVRVSFVLSMCVVFVFLGIELRIPLPRVQRYAVCSFPARGCLLVPQRLISSWEFGPNTVVLGGSCYRVKCHLAWASGELY